MMMTTKRFAHQTGIEDGKCLRSPTTGWRGEDAEAYEAGYWQGFEMGQRRATAVAGLFGVCVVWEDGGTGARRVEYLDGKNNNGKDKQ